MRELLDWPGVIALGSVLLVSSAASIGKAQTLSDEIAPLQALERDFDALRATTETVDQKIELLTLERTPDPRQPSFFELSNPSVWLLWTLLIGCIALLVAFRRSIAPSVQRVLSQPVVGIQKTSKGQQKKVLVQPVKVVKIKVRKIKAKRRP